MEQFWVDSGENELREAFLVFDREGNGYLTQDDFKKVMSTLGERLTEDELKEIIKDCNVNTDGTINYEGMQNFKARNMRFSVSIFSFIIRLY